MTTIRPGALGLVMATLAAGSLAWATPAAAQTQAIHLNQYRPAASIDDGFAISRPDDRGHMLFGARLDLDYALNPLVVEGIAGDSSTEQGSLVEHQLAAHLNLSMGLFERLVICLGLPINLMQEGQSFMTLPGGDGGGLGDMFLGVRGRIIGEPNDTFALALQLGVSFPTAGAANSGQRYSGERGASFTPALLAELRPMDRLRITANVGARLRTQAAQVINLTVDHELTWGVGVTLEAMEDFLDVYLEGYGAAGLASIGGQGAREATPFEMLLGARVHPIREMDVGLAFGTGLTRGYGTPDLRGVLTVGWAQRPIREDVDTDGDGLMDPEDSCPTEPEDFDGFEDEEGCPDPDNDQDGILDDPDECPMEPEDIDQFEDENGCPDPDNDQDTVLDVDDRCPLEPGVPEHQGCPAPPVHVEIDESEIHVLERIEFEVDSDALLSQSESILSEVRTILAQNPEIELVRIEGHTDSRHGRDHNMELSMRRARTVVLWLVGHGVHSARLESWGCGENHPVGSNRTEDGRRGNRRVEFHILRPEPPTGIRSLPNCEQIAHDQEIESGRTRRHRRGGRSH